MTKSDIIKEVAEGTGLTKVEIEAVLEGVILSISDSLDEENVWIFGVLAVLLSNNVLHGMLEIRLLGKLLNYRNVLYLLLKYQRY